MNYLAHKYRRLFLLLPTLCAIISGISAQDNRKYWSDGILSWTDFNENTTGKGIGEIACSIDYYYGKKKSEAYTIYRNFTSSFMNRDLSWVNTQFKNDQYLSYNQVIFNITELYRRELQYELDMSKSIGETGKKYEDVMQNYNAEIEEFKKNSENGENVENIKQKADEVDVRLAQMNDIRLPEYTEGSIALGLHAGFGKCFPAGSFMHYAEPTTSMVAGIDLVYKKYILIANIMSTQWKLKTLYAPIYDLGKHLPMDIISLSLGFMLYDKPKFSFFPFAGYAYHSSTDLGWKETSNGYIFGINGDLKLRNKIKYVPYKALFSSKIIVPAIRTRVYVSNLNLNDDLNGNIINISFGFSRTERPIKINN